MKFKLAAQIIHGWGFVINIIFPFLEGAGMLNMHLTAKMHTISKMASEGALPAGDTRIWYDQSDGATDLWIDQKLLFLGIYVLNDTFTEVKGMRLIKGHTHSGADALFGWLSQKLQELWLTDINAYCRFVQDVLGDK